ncbi:ribose-phosphate pyrophosphokinase [Scheffersomyces spartinae]|uniref:ribose-phosphate diphosphokinase n=1 Tax=Scheffersomyces spartinae TaxID=45513 RepID=A0A9P7V640_9ASCO|nr:ribose-phosphate pyrophosphokinase [Scheffersomyces spartinae]KAG7191614.1 ribose-phosphate pyrophosphokinase [Scheffersomyces spartinae]
MRDLVVLGGLSHPDLTKAICRSLVIEQGQVLSNKFSNGETSIEIKNSVREKDVFIVQSGCGHVNDNFIELLIMIAACKTASARRVTAVLPFFPYSRQADVPYKSGGNGAPSISTKKELYTFELAPGTPRPLGGSSGQGIGLNEIATSPLALNPVAFPNSDSLKERAALNSFSLKQPIPTLPNEEPSSGRSSLSTTPVSSQPAPTQVGAPIGTGHLNAAYTNSNIFEQLDLNGKSESGYKQWIAQNGTLIANLLVGAGADRCITMDLHDPQFQGFFNVPVDNLYLKPLLKKYITQYIPNYQDCVIVSPDSGGAKRATSIADSLGCSFALIHKERRAKVFKGTTSTHGNNHPTYNSNVANIASASGLSLSSSINSSNHNHHQHHSHHHHQHHSGSESIGGHSVVATTMLVGDVKDKVCVLVDDLVDTSYTITRAAKLLKDQGAKYVFALVTHGVFSGDAINRINKSAIDKLITTNSVPQIEHIEQLGDKIQVLDVSRIFAESIRRIHNGESVSMLFDYGY